MMVNEAPALTYSKLSKTWLRRPGVAIRRWLPMISSALMVCALAGCGGSNTNIQNPPAPATTSVSIAFQPPPAKSISLSTTTTSLTAVVSNDPSNAGVDWALVCPSNATCGSLAPLHTPSGVATNYAPPSTITGNTQAVTIEAFATADHSKNVVAGIAVTGFAGNLKGTYVFETKGTDGNGPFQLAGVVVLDGNGGITSGEQTHSDPLITVADTITGGSYYLGPDGRGTLTINTADINIGQQGIENLSLVFLSSSQALIATVDNPNLAQSFETSSGELDLQTSKAAPTAGYAFAVNGTDLSPAPMAIGGIFKIDSPNTISGAGSVADQDDNGTITTSATLSGTVTNPDSFGALKFNLTTSFTPTPLQFTGYIVDTVHIKLIESDHMVAGTGFGSTAGVAISQGAATGAFTSNAAFAGTYVFGISGQDLTGSVDSLASAGLFTADASGNLNSGYNDEVLIGELQFVSDSFTGTYTLDATGTGRVDSSITYTTSGPGPEFIFYLTGNGNAPLVLDAESTFGSVGIGAAQPQAAAAPFTFNGKYGLQLSQSNAQNENDGTAQITASETSGTLFGFIDSSVKFFAYSDFPISGSFVPALNGRFTGDLTNSNFTAPTGGPPNTIGVAFYLIDSAHGYVIETDSSTSGELSLGYFAARIALCSSCQ